MTGFIFRKCLEALSLVLGVVLVLLLVFESGVLGDPALLEAGEHAENAQVAETRVRLGIWQAWDPRALTVTGPGLTLEGGLGELIVRDTEGEWTQKGADIDGEAAGDQSGRSGGEHDVSSKLSLMVA